MRHVVYCITQAVSKLTLWPVFVYVGYWYNHDKIMKEKLVYSNASPTSCIL